MKKLAIIALPLAALAGCNTTQNERTWIGTPQHDAEYGASMSPAFKPTPRPERPLMDDAPSITSLVRDEWPTQVFVVPMDGVASQRTYAYEVSYTDETARQRGQHPSVLSSLELSGDTKWWQYVECWANPFVAFGDAVIMPARMIAHAPWRESLSYPAMYWRAPEFIPRIPPATTPGTHVNGAVTPADVHAPAVAARPD